MTHEDMLASILAVFDRATVSDIESGARWYDEAGTVIDTIQASAPGYSRDHVAAVIAHLSPRTTWARNIAGAATLILDGTAYGCIGANIERARRAMESDYPLATINGPKTKNFAANMLGDREAVTIDVWALRVAGVLDEKFITRKGGYEAVASAYREAARLRGIDPATMQAVTWVVARNGRAG